MANIVQLHIPFASVEQEDAQEEQLFEFVPKGRKVIWTDYANKRRMLTPTAKAGKNPCEKCYLKGLCDADECGRKLHPIDVNEIY